MIIMIIIIKIMIVFIVSSDCALSIILLHFVRLIIPAFIQVLT